MRWQADDFEGKNLGVNLTTKEVVQRYRRR